MIVNCKHCHKSFDKIPSQVKKSPNHFCSNSCSASFNNVGKVKNKPVPRTCKLCKVSFFRNGGSTVYCAACYDSIPDSEDLTLGEVANGLAVKGRHPSWKWAVVRNFARNWNKDKTQKPCVNCGYSKHVELAHIKAISSFPLTATLKEVNAPHNVIQLCRNCHWEFDHGLLTIERPQQESNLHESI